MAIFWLLGGYCVYEQQFSFSVIHFTCLQSVLTRKKAQKETIVKKPLEIICSQFIDERRSLGHITLGEVAYLYIWLRGRGIANTAPGFTVFLKRSGVRRPTLMHLTSEHIAAYWEYVAQLYGLLEAAEAMRAIKQFWQWCAQNKYIPLQPVPADLIGNSVARPYHHKFKIVKPTSKGSRNDE